jgi:hypothetical protein
MQTGQLAQAGKVKLTGPRLMLLPLNDAGETQMSGKTKVWTPFTAPCAGWTSTLANHGVNRPTEVSAKCDGAEGGYAMRFAGRDVEIEYHFTISKPVNPRQVGLVFGLPRECEKLSWERLGHWDVYPEDHIARLKGKVRASEGFAATSVGPREQPDHPWRLDALPYGNNDFCSTKHGITVASLTDPAGHGIRVDGRGRQHLRCWRTEAGVHFLVADYSSGGSERFLRGLAKRDDRPLKPGDKIAGTIHLSLLP